MSFRTFNPKFQKNWTKTEAAPALPCLAGELPKLADRLCFAVFSLDQLQLWSKFSEILDLSFEVLT